MLCLPAEALESVSSIFLFWFFESLDVFPKAERKRISPCRKLNLWKWWKRNTGLRSPSKKIIFIEQEEEATEKKKKKKLLYACAIVELIFPIVCVRKTFPSVGAQFGFVYTKWPNVSRTAINESARCVWEYCKKKDCILTGHENCIGFYFRIEQKEPPNNNGERERKSFFMVI